MFSGCTRGLVHDFHVTPAVFGKGGAEGCLEVGQIVGGVGAGTNHKATLDSEGKVKRLENNVKLVEDVNDLNGLSGNGDAKSSELSENSREWEAVSAEVVVLSLLSGGVLEINHLQDSIVSVGEKSVECLLNCEVELYTISVSYFTRILKCFGNDGEGRDTAEVVTLKVEGGLDAELPK
jgi:hypothetical protein